MWTDYYDGVYLISLPNSHQRRAEALTQLKLAGIGPDTICIHEATYHSDGYRGIFDTLQMLFKSCLYAGDRRILVFEDDVVFVRDPAPVMDCVHEELDRLAEGSWDMVYLGPNTHQPFRERVSAHLLRLYNGFARHAVAYSEAGMRKIMNLTYEGNRTLDQLIADHIQHQGKTLCTYPLLATQANTYSDIERRHVNREFIVQRFIEHTKDVKP